MKIFFIILAVVIIFSIGYLRATDPTDKGRFKRSGLHWYKDHGTGCHYIAGSNWFGSTELIPRLDKFGNHMCD